MSTGSVRFLFSLILSPGNTLFTGFPAKTFDHVVVTFEHFADGLEQSSVEGKGSRVRFHGHPSLSLDLQCYYYGLIK
jgi:hypothetical protein